MVTRNDVTNAYRFILGREPEGEPALEAHLQHRDIEALRRHFLDSEEFTRSIEQVKGEAPATLGRFTEWETQFVEHDCSPETLQQMLEKTSQAWNQFGEDAPHWSVLVNDDFLPGTIDQNIDRFYASGVGDVHFCLNSLRRAGIPAERFERVLDFGCGVGRLSLALAQLADHVTAIDVSAGHLKLARERAAVSGVNNVDWVQLRDLRALDQFSGYDLVRFSDRSATQSATGHGICVPSPVALPAIRRGRHHSDSDLYGRTFRSRRISRKPAKRDGDA